MLCGSCSQRHGGLVQMCLALCPTWAIFWLEWRQLWNGRTSCAHSWLHTASDRDNWLCARLLIPLSLLDPVPQQQQYRIRSVVGLFPFRAMQGVHGLCRRLVASTTDLLPSPLWVTRFTTKHYTPRETP